MERPCINKVILSYQANPILSRGVKRVDEAHPLGFRSVKAQYPALQFQNDTIFVRYDVIWSKMSSFDTPSWISLFEKKRRLIEDPSQNACGG